MYCGCIINAHAAIYNNFAFPVYISWNIWENGNLVEKKDMILGGHQTKRFDTEHGQTLIVCRERYEPKCIRNPRSHVALRDIQEKLLP